MTSSVFADVSSAHPSPLWRLIEPERERLWVAALLALLGHASLAWYAATRPSAPMAVATPLDVEFVQHEPPPPPEPPSKPQVEAAEAAPPKAAAPERVLAKAAPPPAPAAAAGAVLTALPEPAPVAPAEPFDFTTDPDSAVYGSGIVARGGSAEHGLTGAALGGRAAEPAPAPPRGDGLTGVSDLSQRPRLREHDPCRGFFPKAATDDAALVSLRVVIGKRGDVRDARVVSESPSGQGFGAAARACMLGQTFTPALDGAGRPAATALPVNVRFSR